jgi:hypothetical protein
MLLGIGLDLGHETVVLFGPIYSKLDRQFVWGLA